MAKLDLKLETQDQAAAGGLDDHRAAEIGARAEIHRDHAGGLSNRASRRAATIPLANATPTPVEFDDFFNMFDRPTRAGERLNLRGFGDAFAGRGEDLNNAIQAVRAAGRERGAGADQYRRPGHAAGGASSPRRRGPRSSSRRSPRSRASCGRTSTSRSPRSPTSRGRSCRRRSEVARRALQTAIETLPADPAVLPQHRAVLRRAAARRRGARESAPTLASAFTKGIKGAGGLARASTAA